VAPDLSRTLKGKDGPVTPVCDAILSFCAGRALRMVESFSSSNACTDFAACHAAQSECLHVDCNRSCQKAEAS
jgi:hypothetical protein